MIMVFGRGRALDRWVEVLLGFGAAGRWRVQSVVVSRVEFGMGDLIFMFEGIKTLLHVELWISCNEVWERG